MRRKGLLWVFIALMLLAACGAADSAEPDEAPEPDAAEERDETGGQEGEPDAEAADTKYPLTVTDDSGTEVTIAEEPRTIISVLPSVTEIVFALGLDEEVIAVTENDDYPEEVHDKEKVGGMELNMEKIVSLEPDLVIAGLLNGKAVEKMRDLGLTVLVAEGEDLAGTYASIELIGEVTNRAAEAEAIVSAMKDDVAYVQDNVADIPEDEQVNVWIEVSPDLFTPGAGTSMDELITLAGGRNVAADELDGWGQLSEENVVALNPDVIIGTYGEDEVQKAVADRTSWSELGAVENDRVYGIEASILERTGPRLTEGLLRLAELFYPDAFLEQAS